MSVSERKVYSQDVRPVCFFFFIRKAHIQVFLKPPQTIRGKLARHQPRNALNQRLRRLASLAEYVEKVVEIGPVLM